jgi:hypothetical protein
LTAPRRGLAGNLKEFESNVDETLNMGLGIGGGGLLIWHIQWFELDQMGKLVEETGLEE